MSDGLMYSRIASNPTGVGSICGDLTHGGFLTDLSISGGVIHVAWLASGPQDGDCCPSVKTGDLR